MSKRNPFDLTDVTDLSEEVRGNLTSKRNKYSRVFAEAPNEFTADQFYAACHRMNMPVSPTTARQALYANVKRKNLVKKAPGRYAVAS